MLLATTLLPVLLAWLGPWLEAGRLWRRDAEAERARYRRWAGFVVERPRLVLALTLPPLLLLAAQSRRLDPAEPHGNWLPAETESARAETDLAAMERRGVLYALRVVVFLPDEVQALSAEGWQASRTLASALAADPRVAAVRSLRSLLAERATGDTREELEAAALAPALAKRSFLAEEGDAFLLEVIPREDQDGRARVALARDLRKVDAAQLTGLGGTRLAVGGLPAFSADYEAAGQGGPRRGSRDRGARDAHRTLRRLPLAARTDQGGAAQPALGGRRVRRAGRGVPGRPWRPPAGPRREPPAASSRSFQRWCSAPSSA